MNTKTADQGKWLHLNLHIIHIERPRYHFYVQEPRPDEAFRVWGIGATTSGEGCR